MTDFSTISKSGFRFQELVSELLEKMGYIILQRPGVGPDGGKDILVERRLRDEMGERRERVVVQCKHFAHSGRAVREGDLGVWTNALHRYNANGYLLVTSTRVTENLLRAFAEFTRADGSRWAEAWSGERLEVLLQGQAELRDAFFPPQPLRLADEWTNYGFGVVCGSQLDWSEVEGSLGPLINLRREQLRRSRRGGDVLLFTGPEGVKPGETALDWLTRQGIGPGTPDPRRVPRFLLLIGTPDEITFEFQTDLAIQYCVGRLSLDAEALRNYSEAVVRAEEEVAAVRPSVNFVAPTHGTDRAMERTVSELIVPLIEELRARLPNVEVGEVVGEKATKAGFLEGLLDVDYRLSFVAAHGLAVNVPHPDVNELQGAHVTADWRAFGDWNHHEYLVTAADFGDAIDLTGRLFFLYGCYSAGLSTSGLFDESDVLHSASFVAALPRRLLGLGAFGVIGHVGRAWTTAFSWVPERPQPHTFLAVVESILRGEPIGLAMQVLSRRYAELTAALASAELANAQPDLVSRLRRALFDARYYVLLGDPCCRLRASM